MSRTVKRPSVELDARGKVETHGHHDLVRGIWHDTESHDFAGIQDLQGIVNFWNRQGKGYGAHVIIDKDGNSALCANPNEITWHTGLRNTGSWGMELVGLARFSTHLWVVRYKQLQKAAKWMAWLNLEFDVPLRFDIEHGWSGHRNQPRQFHTDPGLFFPKAMVLRWANGYRENGW